MVTSPVLLTVMAHPDDAELWAGGTIARHIQTGGTATIAVPKLDPTRTAEATAGARILGADLYLLDQLTAAAISTLLTEVRPDIVITHSTDDIHPEHRRCAERVLAALPEMVIATGHPSRAYHCDGYNNLGQRGVPLDLPTIIDITDQWQIKIAALQSHNSQPIRNHFGPMAESLARLHGLRIGKSHAEAFHVLPILGRVPAASGL
ncbi:PIG-L deacetylase family protein [Asanoa siamensis]|uniref:PIG-L domain-containing protein n=1 Tax=Asanoa siamensis TaxID=926357 RepID=A0ABQ4CY55_9ACTN|nr:PIG-L deacetylase family protein [Asanoa siamensis]GIF76199.1 PIG-L domain-containing protein [Asanoa siamensis]